MVACVIVLRRLSIGGAAWSRLLLSNFDSHVWGSGEQVGGPLLHILSDKVVRQRDVVDK